MRSPSKPPSGPPQVRGISASDIATRNGVSAWLGATTASDNNSANARIADLDHHRIVMGPSPLEPLGQSKRRARRDKLPPSSSLRGAEQRRNPGSRHAALDCFASLAMTTAESVRPDQA